MIPGETILAASTLTLNEASQSITLCVANTGDRPVQVASHFHFAEVNPALEFDRAKAQGMRLDVPAGTSIRFEPGQRRDIALIPFKGKRRVVGFRGETMGEVSCQ